MKKLFISMIAVSLVSCSLIAAKKTAKTVEVRSPKKTSVKTRTAKYVAPVSKKVVEPAKEYKSNLRIFKERASN